MSKIDPNELVQDLIEALRSMDKQTLETFLYVESDLVNMLRAHLNSPRSKLVEVDGIINHGGNTDSPWQLQVGDTYYTQNRVKRIFAEVRDPLNAN